MATQSLEQTIIETTEIRRHNGQCEYGKWIDLGDESVPYAVKEAVAGEVGEAMCRDMRREETEKNTDEAGQVNVGGQIWVYRR